MIYILPTLSRGLLNYNTSIHLWKSLNIFIHQASFGQLPCGHLHNYFNLHVCPSLRRRPVRPSVRPTFEFPIPAGVWQSVTNKSWLVCVKSEKYTFLVTTRPLGSKDKEKARYIHFDIRREEAKLRILKLASVFHQLPSFGPKQLCALAHLGYTCKLGTF